MLLEHILHYGDWIKLSAIDWLIFGNILLLGIFLSERHLLIGCIEILDFPPIIKVPRFCLVDLLILDSTMYIVNHSLVARSLLCHGLTLDLQSWIPIISSTFVGGTAF